VTSAGRELGINQSGFSPGIGYYHKSGFFADISANIYSEADPNYAYTVISGGYSGFLGKKWNYLLSYDHFFYNETSITDPASEEISIELSNPYSNTLSSSMYFNDKWFTLGLDYSFLFGDEQAHRILPSVSGTLSFKNIPLFDEISVFPAFSVIFGNQSIVYQQFNRNSFENGVIEAWRALPGRQRLILTNAIRNGTLSRQEVAILLVDPLEFITDIEEDNFGLMNYGFSLPVSFRKDNFSILAAYMYNIPRSFPNEPDIPSYGYFRLTLTYSFIFI
jgi:hypothetical protein